MGRALAARRSFSHGVRFRADTHGQAPVQAHTETDAGQGSRGRCADSPDAALHGSTDPAGVWGSLLGRVYATTMRELIMEVCTLRGYRRMRND